MSGSLPAGPQPADLWPEVQPDAARRLMLAGVESFARRGYHATTTRDIAAAAGMSPAALYVHFPSKAALLFAISRSGHEQALSLVQRAQDDAAGPVEAMRELVEQFTAWHARRHTIARVVQYELGALPEQEYAVVASLRRDIEELVRTLVERGRDEGLFTVGDPHTAARAVLSLGVDVARWYTDRARQTPDELAKEYGDLTLQMLGAAHHSPPR
ncbi:TetR family transcriptional regulator [Saccharomonospora sp. CUA-673]|uniref:TetR/AcrR family transcriptional regulator n=1 Tax=Saccharomonospora sp. CUA-673 TaxID=1904969 RepID=UPI00095EAA6B|nr:TetR/AcrR family transcriptional regulator [Saccharomonospora sp. CUA-673]OLT38537.1 TetR family transcriptional regulator [Saccharomonospora sp. CUA-673]